MRRELIEIRNLLENNKRSEESSSTKHAENEPEVESNVAAGTDINESIVSIEEFMADPTCPPPSSSHLNLEDSTIQLM